MMKFYERSHNMQKVVNIMAEKKESDPKAQKAALSAAKAFVSNQSFKTDPSGSYTGDPKDKDEKPVQDADDL